MSISKLSFLFLAMLLSLHSFAQTNDEDRANTTVDTIKEVFLKGSIDGDQMFMVLGMEKGTKISKKILETMINGDDLADIKDSAVSIGDAIVDMQDIVKQPWKSLKKIPQSYKVDFERAQAAYYGADNQIAGVLKYSGWAVWANVKGAYYLVVETPTVAAYQIVESGVVTAWRITGLGFTIAGKAVKAALGVIASAAVMTYSTVSSSVATTATLIAAGGVAVFKGGKWLIVTMPSQFVRPVHAQIATGEDYTTQEALAKKVAEFTQEHTDLFGANAMVIFDINKYKSEFEVRLVNEKSKAFKAFSLRTFIKNQKIFFKLEATRDYLRFEKHLEENDGMSGRELKQKIQLHLSQILETINSNV